MQDLEHYYTVLGIDRDASLSQIKEAYRDLVKVWHPDRFTGDSKLQNRANEKLKKINEAYHALTEYHSRRQEAGQAWEHTQHRTKRAHGETGRGGEGGWSPPRDDEQSRERPASWPANRGSDLVPILLIVLLLFVGLAIRAHYLRSTDNTPTPAVLGKTEPSTSPSLDAPTAQSTVPPAAPQLPAQPPNPQPTLPSVSEQLQCGPLIVRYSALGKQPGVVHIADVVGEVHTVVSDWKIKVVECRTVTGGEIPDLIIGSFSGGPHCCSTVQVFVTKPFHRVLQYEGAEFYDSVETRSNSNGTRGLLLDDNHFAYFDSLSYAYSPSSFPMVACFNDDHFNDCTTQFPSVLVESIESFTGELRKAVNMSSDNLESREERIRGMALGLYASYILADREDAGLAAIREIVASDSAISDSVIIWLSAHKTDILGWIAARGPKLLAK
jgi:hypothetical protein